MRKSAFACALCLGAGACATVEEVDLLEVRSKAVESTPNGGRHSWRVRASNAGEQEKSCELLVRWYDDGDFVLEEEREHVQLPCCGTVETFEGYRFIAQPMTDRVRAVGASLKCIPE